MGVKRLLKAQSFKDVLDELWNITWYLFSRLVIWTQISAILQRVIFLVEKSSNTPNVVNTVIHRFLIFFFKTWSKELILENREDLLTHVDQYVATCHAFRHPIRVLRIFMPISIPWCALLQWNLPVMNTWNVEKVTDFSHVFSSRRNPYMRKNFNEYLGDWNIINAVDVSHMFRQAEEFHGLGLHRWKLNNYDGSSSGSSSVEKMDHMFDGCYQFNSDLSSWNTTGITDMSFMFNEAKAFQGRGLEYWDVSRVTNMDSMFKGSTQFNGDLRAWNVSSVTSMQFMFFYAKAFEGHGVEHWNVTKRTTNTKRMFVGADSLHIQRMPFGGTH